MRIITNILPVLFLLSGCILGKTPQGLVHDLESSDHDIRQKAAAKLTAIGKPSVEPLIEALQIGSDQSKYIATQVLGSIGDSTAVAPLIVLLNHDHEHIRAAAAEALGKLSSLRAYGPLRKACRDSMLVVREKAIYALGNFNDSGNLDVLLEAIFDPVHDIRKKAIEAVWRTRDPVALSGLMITASDSIDGVRYVTAQALGYFDTWSSVKTILDLLWDDHPYIRIEAAESLAKLKANIAVPDLKKAYDSGTPLERERIAIAIRTITGNPFVPERE